MIQKLEGVVENGTLKLSTPLQGLPDGKRVHVLVAPVIEPADYQGLSEQEREDLFWKDLEAQGLLDTYVWSTDPPLTEDFKPFMLPPGGPLMSEMIIEDRR